MAEGNRMISSKTHQPPYVSLGRVIIATDTLNEDRCANQDTLTRSDG